MQDGGHILMLLLECIQFNKDFTDLLRFLSLSLAVRLTTLPQTHLFSGWENTKYYGCT